MTIETIRAALGWCSIINMGMLLLWFLMLVLAHDLIYRVHSKWFKMSVEKFDEIHYTGIIFFKIVWFVFNLVPYFALRIIG